MALPLGKLTILVGAGIVGSVLAKEGRVSDVSDFFSGAFKIVWKQIRQDNSTPSSAKPRSDSLMAQKSTRRAKKESEKQVRRNSEKGKLIMCCNCSTLQRALANMEDVNSLRQELQLLASNRSVTIVTTSGSGSSKYGIIIVVVVVGYGYAWWKGWKLPDMMFATRRSLSDACTSIAKQLENVYSAVSATKRHLSSRIDRVDCSLNECAELTNGTREEVSELRGEMKVVGVDVQYVHNAVQSLETKINRIEGKQNMTYGGIMKLVNYAQNLENGRTTERIQETPSSSSRPAPELPQITPSSRTGSLPPIMSLEPPSPSDSNGSSKVQRTLHSAVSASGLKDLYGISGAVDASGSSEVSNGVHVSEDTNNGGSAGVFGRKIACVSASFLTRTRSAMQSFK